MASIIEQIFLQAGGGPSAQGQSLPLAQAFERGRRLRMDQERHLEEMETEQLQQKVFAQMFEFNETMNKLKLYEALINMEKTMEVERFNAGANTLQSNAMANPEVMESEQWQQKFFELMKFPGAMGTDQGQALWNMWQQRQALAKGMEMTQQSIPTPGGGTATFKLKDAEDILDEFQAQLRSIDQKLRLEQLKAEARSTSRRLGEIDRAQMNAELDAYTNSMQAFQDSPEVQSRTIQGIIEKYRSRLGDAVDVDGIEIPSLEEFERQRRRRSIPSRESILSPEEQRRFRSGTRSTPSAGFDWEYDEKTGQMRRAR